MKPGQSPSDRRHRVAVWGTGSIGMRHLRVLSSQKDCQVFAIPRRLERMAPLVEEGYDAVRSLDEAAEKGATHCIIATNTGDHLSDGLKAIEKKFHVLMEKPLCVDAAQARKFCRQAEALKRSVFVGCPLRFSKSLQQFRDLLSQIGPVHRVQVECQSYLPDWRPARPYGDGYSAKKSEGGVLRDLIHEIDYAGWIYGWPAALQAKIRNLGRLKIESEEAADLWWEIAGGPVVSVCIDYLSRPTRRFMRASGNNGTLEWDGVKDTVGLALHSQPVQSIACVQTRDDMLLSQDLEFISSGPEKGSARLPSGEEGIKALAICDAARIASDLKREVSVDYLEEGGS